jgi:hypothetical protein
MRDPKVIQQLERRLVELGCVGMESQVREVAEHFEDLREAAIEEGLGESEAELIAAERLGDPRAIAERLAAELRVSSWWGRHRVISYCLLPPVGIMTGTVLLTLGALWFVRACCSPAQWSALADGELAVRAAPVFSVVAYSLAVGVVTALSCWMARRSAAGWKWVYATCVVCALQSSFGYCQVRPHVLSLGYASMPRPWFAAVPLVIAVFLIQRRRRAFRNLDKPLSGLGVA